MCPFYWFWAEFVRIACSFKSYILLPCSCQKRDSLICSPFSSNYSAINFVWPINSTKWKETHRKFLWFYLNALESAFSISSIPVVIHCTANILSAKNTTFRWCNISKELSEKSCVFSRLLVATPFSFCDITFEPIEVQSHSAPQNDCFNLSFVKDVDGRKMAGNGRRRPF